MTWKKPLIFSLIGASLLVHGLAVSAAGSVADPPPPSVKNPLLANYFIEPIISKEDQENLAKFDLVILDKEVPHNYPSLLTRLRQKNPRIKILAYVPVQHVSSNLKPNNPATALSYKLKSSLLPNWYLRKSTHEIVSVWPNTAMVNMTSGWQDFLPHFVAFNILKNNEWDGVFYDGIEEKISWTSRDIDLDSDWAADPSDEIDWRWKNATVHMLEISRRLFGRKLILANTANEIYAPYLNGILYENFANWPGYLWPENFARLRQSVRATLAPHLIVVNGTTSDTGYNKDYRRVRYGLVTALLADAYFSFDYGPTRHGQTWWYDDYSFDLGQPSGPVRLVVSASAGKEDLRQDYFTAGMDRHALYKESAQAEFIAGRVKGQDAIDGYSIKAVSPGRQWNEFLRSDPRLLPLAKNTGYEVTFKYKILQPSIKGYFYFGTRSDLRPDLGNRQVVTWNGAAGESGLVTAFITPRASDYYLYYGIKHDGAVVLDNISVKKLGTGLWQRDFARGTVYLNNSSRAMGVGSPAAAVSKLILAPDDGLIVKQDETARTEN
ncbi:hypothetical protein HY224_02370 [Candidatus Uhrbacteria bacterium]|nr:hypothetical protein [Candidatus Uhrbacteria bacterium]